MIKKITQIFSCVELRGHGLNGRKSCMPIENKTGKIAVVDPVKMENPYHFVCYKCECRECETSTYLLFATTTYSWVLTGNPCHRLYSRPYLLV